MKLSTKIRGYLIKLLAGELPVVLNVVVARPHRYSGNLIDLSKSTEHVVGNNFLLNTQRIGLITPVRDTLYSPKVKWDVEGFISRSKGTLKSPKPTQLADSPRTGNPGRTVVRA